MEASSTRELPLGASSRPAAEQDAAIWDAAASVCDPEIPVLTLADLGVLRDAYLDGDVAHVIITPTYSGCPAMGTMHADVEKAVKEAGYPHVAVEHVLHPAWTTEWMSDEGKRKLERYGIAPPVTRPSGGPVALTLGMKCPHCGSFRTHEMSRFGSTSCKALWVCQACLEPFDYFKVH